MPHYVLPSTHQPTAEFSHNVSNKSSTIQNILTLTNNKIIKKNLVCHNFNKPKDCKLLKSPRNKKEIQTIVNSITTQICIFKPCGMKIEESPKVAFLMSHDQH